MKIITVALTFSFLGYLCGRYLFPKEVTKVVTKTKVETHIQEKAEEVDSVSQKLSSIKKTKNVSVDLNKALEMAMNPDPELRDFKQVSGLFKSVLKSQPNNLQALEYYSNYLMFSSDFDQAEKYLDRCLSVMPNNDLCLHNKSMVLMEKGQLDQAKTLVQKCIDEKPSSVSCNMNLSALYARNQDYQAALQVLEDLERKAEQKENFYYDASFIKYQKAFYLRELGDSSLSQELFSESCAGGFESACEEVF